MKYRLSEQGLCDEISIGFSKISQYFVDAMLEMYKRIAATWSQIFREIVVCFFETSIISPKCEIQSPIAVECCRWHCANTNFASHFKTRTKQIKRILLIPWYRYSFTHFQPNMNWQGIDYIYFKWISQADRHFVDVLFDSNANALHTRNNKCEEHLSL